MDEWKGMSLEAHDKRLCRHVMSPLCVNAAVFICCQLPCIEYIQMVCLYILFKLYRLKAV